MSAQAEKIIDDFCELPYTALYHRYGGNDDDLLLLIGQKKGEHNLTVGLPHYCDIAFSGGPDSTLLALLYRIKYYRSGFTDTKNKIYLHHMVHGIRPENNDLWIVQQTADLLNATLKIYYPTTDLSIGSNVEARARGERRKAFPKGTLTGHNLDDDVETFFLNVFRGSGLPGISGMDLETKPLLRIPSAQIRKTIDAIGIEVVKDETNDSSLYRRNRIRNELIPLINDICDKNVSDNIVSLMHNADISNRKLDSIAKSEYIKAYNTLSKNTKLSHYDNDWYEKPLDARVIKHLPEDEGFRVIRLYVRYHTKVILTKSATNIIHQMCREIKSNKFYEIGINGRVVVKDNALSIYPYNQYDDTSNEEDIF